jgi:hypothetical protein
MTRRTRVIVKAFRELDPNEEYRCRSSGLHRIFLPRVAYSPHVPNGSCFSGGVLYKTSNTRSRGGGITWIMN